MHKPKVQEDSLKAITMQFKFRYHQNVYTHGGYNTTLIIGTNNLFTRLFQHQKHVRHQLYFQNHAF